MKKAILIIFIFTCCSLALFSADGSMYLRSLPSTAGIPLNPPRGPNYRYTPIHTSNGLLSDQNKYIHVDGLLWDDRPDLQKGQYSAWETMIIGGVESLTAAETDNLGLQVDVLPENGFYMYSLSNPSYRRPYDLYLIPRALKLTPIPFLGGFSKDAYLGVTQIYGEHGANKGTSHDISFEDMGLSYKGGSNLYLGFDLVLVLDGTIENNELVYEGKSYPLVVADDYSTRITVTIRTFRKENGQKVLTGAEQEISIPISGFYTETAADKTKQKVGMHVSPKPAASNINMKNYGLQEIADLSVNAVYEYNVWDVLTPTYAYGLFLSSSPNPYAKGDPFLLKKDDIVYPIEPNDHNSVGFKVYLKGTDPDINQEYTGEQFVDSSITQDNVNKQYPFVITPSASNGSKVKGHRNKNSNVYKCDATASIKIDNNAAVLMQAGRYESTIYVHVIALAQGIFQ